MSRVSPFSNLSMQREQKQPSGCVLTTNIWRLMTIDDKDNDDDDDDDDENDDDDDGDNADDGGGNSDRNLVSSGREV